MGASGHWFGRRGVLLVERRVDIRLMVVFRYAMLCHFGDACAVGIVHSARYLPMSTFKSRHTYGFSYSRERGRLGYKVVKKNIRLA